MTTTHPLRAQLGPVPHGHNAVSAAFWSGCAAGELRYQRCVKCERANFPPSEHCRYCLSTDWHWELSQGRGEIYSWTVVHRSVTPEFIAPYAPAIVTLTEGYQMLTNIIETTIDELRVGLRVRVQFRSDEAGFVLPYFTRDRINNE
jgi:uncharacterized OB-fold protein